ncbi:MAG: ribosome maturation factor RimM [Gammaproteobacteria bacterium]|nr:ribosome maturation factor RimM [Gammaproteobacteria bacterium]
MPTIEDARDPRASTSSRVLLGSVKAVFGTRGWIKIHSETRPRDGIFDYPRWLIGTRDDWDDYLVAEWREQGTHLIAKLDGIDDRTGAEGLVGKRIAIAAAALPAPPAGSYYWRDLIGLRVVNRDGEQLGVVDRLVETGSSDVLCVRGARETLIPFVHGVYIERVDSVSGVITVDWPTDE